MAWLKKFAQRLQGSQVESPITEENPQPFSLSELLTKQLVALPYFRRDYVDVQVITDLAEIQWMQQYLQNPYLLNFNGRLFAIDVVAIRQKYQRIKLVELPSQYAIDTKESAELVMLEGDLSLDVYLGSSGEVTKIEGRNIDRLAGLTNITQIGEGAKRFDDLVNEGVSLPHVVYILIRRRDEVNNWLKIHGES